MAYQAFNAKRQAEQQIASITNAANDFFEGSPEEERQSNMEKEKLTAEVEEKEPKADQDMTCCEKFCRSISDKINGVSALELSKRVWVSKHRPLLEHGMCFTIHQIEKTMLAEVGDHVAGVLSTVGGAFNGLFGGGVKESKSQRRASTNTSGFKFAGEQVMVMLGGNAGRTLKWTCVRNEQNKPIAEGEIDFFNINIVKPSGSAAAFLHGITYLDEKGDVLLELEANSDVEMNSWLEASRAALSRLADAKAQLQKDQEQQNSLRGKYADMKKREAARNATIARLKRNR